MEKRKEEEAGMSAQEEAFFRWMGEQQFGLHPKIRFHRFADTGRGVITTEKLSKGTVLFSVPRQALLSPETCQIADLLKDLAEQNSWMALILAMMYESLQPDSRWAPYFAVLPKELTTPLFWSEEDLAELIGTETLEQLGKEKIIADYHNFILPVIQKSDRLDETKLTLDLYLRMGSIVMAYSFNNDEGDIFMVPMADMLNHKTGFNNARLYHEEKALTMTTIKNVPARAEIFNTYGSLGNGELLRKYGFAEEHNPYDSVTIPMRLVLETLTTLRESDSYKANKLQKKKLEFLEEQNMLEDGYELTKPYLPQHLLQVIHILLMDKKEWKRYKKRLKKEFESEVIDAIDEEEVQQQPQQSSEVQQMEEVKEHGEEKQEKQENGDKEEDDGEDDDDESDDEEQEEEEEEEEQVFGEEVYKAAAQILENRLLPYRTSLAEDEQAFAALSSNVANNNTTSESKRRGGSGGRVVHKRAALLVRIGEKRILCAALTRLQAKLSSAASSSPSAN
ncbi:Ribosomal lysine N-methyltransferase 4 [Balamuthia mandrillaris]